MIRIVIVISGRGSNMRAIVEACRAERWPAEIVAVVSNRPDVAGLALARDFGIAVEAVDHTLFDSRVDFDAALAQRIDAYAPDLVVLAGFMRVLGRDFVQHYAGRMLNIHPSLLPLFPGLHTHRQALAAKSSEHGATVHLVTDDLDHGPILAQEVVAVLPDDDERSLAARVLEREHALYPRAIREFIERLSQKLPSPDAGPFAGARPALSATWPADRSEHALQKPDRAESRGCAA